MDKSSLKKWFVSKRNQVKNSLKKAFVEAEDKGVDIYMANTAPFKNMPKGHRERVRKIRRISIVYKKEISYAKLTGKNVIRMWVWYSLIRLPANIKEDSGFLLKLSARGLSILAIADMVSTLNEWSNNKKQ